MYGKNDKNDRKNTPGNTLELLFLSAIEFWKMIFVYFSEPNLDVLRNVYKVYSIKYYKKMEKNVRYNTGFQYYYTAIHSIT